MSYVFDTSSFSVLFGSYYRKPFRSLWQRFDNLISSGEVVSTREVWKELQERPIEALLDWEKQNSQVFTIPTAKEGAFISDIYKVNHFQQNIETQKLLRGGKNADPFVIAKAAVEGRSVVTQEIEKPNSSKIPNICRHFSVPCMNLEDFMHAENWEF